MPDDRVAFADSVLAEIDKRIAEHDDELTDEEVEYVAGLHDAQDIIRAKADRLR